MLLSILLKFGLQSPAKIVTWHRWLVFESSSMEHTLKFRKSSEKYCSPAPFPRFASTLFARCLFDSYPWNRTGPVEELNWHPVCLYGTWPTVIHDYTSAFISGTYWTKASQLLRFFPTKGGLSSAFQGRFHLTSSAFEAARWIWMICWPALWCTFATRYPALVK